MSMSLPVRLAATRVGVAVRGRAVPAETADSHLGFDQLRPTPSGDLAEAPA